MSKFTKQVESEVGPLPAEMIQCDYCAIEQPEKATIGWIHTETSLLRIGSFPLTGDFCSPQCVVAFFSLKQGDEPPDGIKAAQERLIDSLPRYEVKQDGNVLYRGNNEDAMNWFLG